MKTTTVEVPVGFLAAVFFEERARAIRDTRAIGSSDILESLTREAMSVLRAELIKCETPAELDAVMHCWGRISFEDWARSLPSKLPDSW